MSAQDLFLLVLPGPVIDAGNLPGIDRNTQPPSRHPGARYFCHPVKKSGPVIFTDDRAITPHHNTRFYVAASSIQDIVTSVRFRDRLLGEHR